MRSNKSSKISRVDLKFDKIGRDIMRERYDKGLCKLDMKELGLPEMTRLILRAPSWPNVEKELRNLPKGGQKQ